jgi:hypothetical protein
MAGPIIAKTAARAATKRTARRRAVRKAASRSARTTSYVARGAGTYAIRHVKRHAAASNRVARSLRSKKAPNAADLLELIEGGAIYYTASKPIRKRRRNARKRR